jgi:hypothetical protein
VAPTGLLEAVAALALHGVVLASLLTGTTTLALLGREAWVVHAELFAERQVEHLIDTAAARAGSGPATLPVAEASAETIVLHADLDGDGAIDETSSERSAFELRPAAGRADSSTLLYRIGRQGMKIEEGLAGTSTIRLLSRDGGQPAAPADATGVEFPRTGLSMFSVLAARLP